MNVDFVKLGKLMQENKEGQFLLDNTVLKLSKEVYKDRYNSKLSEELCLLNIEISQLERDITELENKNKLLTIITDKKFGKRINNHTHFVNNEKIRLNETTIEHLQLKKYHMLEIIKQNMRIQK